MTCRFAASLFVFAASAVQAAAADEPLEVLSYLEPYRSIEIAAVETGVIADIRVREGDRVKTGDVLLVLDNEITEARLAIAKVNAQGTGRLMATQAEVDLQQQRHDQLARLMSSGTSNAAEMARQKVSLAQAKGNHIIAEEELEIFVLQVAQIEAELKRRVLTTPIDGIVVDIAKDIAEPVGLGGGRDENYLVRVVQIDQLRCVGHLPAAFARSLAVGEQLDLRVEDGAPLTARGVVEFVSPVIDPATATVRVHLKIDNTSGALRSGATAQILLREVGT